MTYKEFLKILQLLKKKDEQISILHETEIDVVNFTDDYHKIIDILLHSVFFEDGVEWINWFCYDSDFGRNELTATDENGDRIDYDETSLWKIVKGYIKPSCKCSV